MPVEGGERAEAADIILVPCAESGRAGCEIVRRAVARVAADTPEALTAESEECPGDSRKFVVAVDASHACRASAALEECGARPSAVISAPAVLAKAGLVRPGVDVRANIEGLAEALTGAIKESLGEVLEELRERNRYRDEMAPVLRRFQSMWTKVEAFPPLDGAPDESARSQVALLAKRARNLFVRFDEVVPPVRWAEPHDLFQDALLCIAFACEGYAAGDPARWRENVEKARVQIRPLLRRFDG